MTLFLPNWFLKMCMQLGFGNSFVTITVCLQFKFIQFNSIYFPSKQQTHLKIHKMEEMQLKAKAWRMLHPLYNLKQQQTSIHNTKAIKESNKACTRNDSLLTTKLHLVICFDRTKSPKPIFHSESATGIFIRGHNWVHFSHFSSL